MDTLEKLYNGMRTLAIVAKKAGIAMADAQAAFSRMLVHRYDGWDKRKIKRYKRKERKLKLKNKIRGIV